MILTRIFVKNSDTINEWDIEIGKNYYVNQKIIGGYSEDKFYRANHNFVDPDPREYDMNGEYIDKNVQPGQIGDNKMFGMVINHQMFGGIRIKISLKKTILSILSQFQGIFSQYWNELADKEPNLDVTTIWKDARIKFFNKMRRDKLSK